MSINGKVFFYCKLHANVVPVALELSTDTVTIRVARKVEVLDSSLNGFIALSNPLNAAAYFNWSIVEGSNMDEASPFSIYPSEGKISGFVYELDVALSSVKMLKSRLHGNFSMLL